MNTEAVWEMGLAVHRGEVDGVQLVQTSGSCDIADAWSDYQIQENCREYVASQNEWVTLDQLEVITFSYVVLQTDDD
jgi:hypothetical protein